MPLRWLLIITPYQLCLHRQIYKSATQSQRSDRYHTPQSHQKQQSIWLYTRTQLTQKKIITTSQSYETMKTRTQWFSLTLKALVARKHTGHNRGTAFIYTGFPPASLFITQTTHTMETHIAIVARGDRHDYMTIDGQVVKFLHPHGRRTAETYASTIMATKAYVFVRRDDIRLEYVDADTDDYGVVERELDASTHMRDRDTTPEEFVDRMSTLGEIDAYVLSFDSDSEIVKEYKAASPHIA